MGISYSGNSIKLEGFCDSDYAADPELRRSTSGFVFMLGNGPITWLSQRQPLVSISTIEAEYVSACMEQYGETVWLRRLLSDIGYPCASQMVLNIYNQSAIKLTKNSKFHKRSKHIDIRYHYVRECSERKVIYDLLVLTNICSN